MKIEGRSLCRRTATMRASWSLLSLMVATVPGAAGLVAPPAARGMAPTRTGVPPLGRIPMPSVLAGSTTQLRHGVGHSHGHHDHDLGHAHHRHLHLPPHPAPGRAGRRRTAALLLAAAAAARLAPSRRLRVLAALAGAGGLLAPALGASLGETRHRLRRLRDRLRAHAPRRPRADGGTAAATQGWRDYLFRNRDAADRVTLLGVAINVALSLGKLLVGLRCHSRALVADAGHSLSDLCSDVVALGSLQLARLPPDEDHPYGHGKFEAVGSLFLALTLLATGAGIGGMANAELLRIWRSAAAGAGAVAATSVAVQVPTPPALVAAFVSIVSKEWLFRVTRAVGERLRSPLVLANAWHHRSDAYSSVLALLSIGLAMYVPGMAFADAAAGLLVAGMICLTGVDILGESINQLTDTAVDQELEGRVRALAAKHGDVRGVTQIRARQVGSKAFMDVSVEIPSGFSSSATRTVEEQVRKRIVAEPYVTDATVRASSRATSGIVVCPLLEAAAAGGSPLPTVTEVESTVRQSMLLKHHDVVVKDVTVHYGEAHPVHVDVNIYIKDSLGNEEPPQTLLYIQHVANEVRNTIITSQEYIQSANIYLDLNEPNAIEPISIIP